MYKWHRYICLANLFHFIYIHRNFVKILYTQIVVKDVSFLPGKFKSTLYFGIEGVFYRFGII
jgi:hypothetical protein